MQFSNFSRLEEGLTITLYNDVPIENSGALLYYSDNASGLFSKKEFRWSFNNTYFSSWETLTQHNLSRVNTNNNYYLFLQFRYILTATGSGSVSTISINYTKGNATNVPIYVDVTSDTSSYYTYDVIQRYIASYVADACTLNGYNGNWYLNRTHHIGQQAISTIIGLQTALNNLASLSALAQYIKSASTGAGLYWNNGLLDVSVAGGTGDVTKAYVDASLGMFIRSASTGFGLFWVNGLLDVSVIGSASNVTKEYVDGSIANFATNASVNNAFLTNVSLGLAGAGGISRAQVDASFATNASVNLGIYSNASLGLAFNQYTNVSLGLVSANYATNASVNNAFLTNASLGLAFSQYSNASLGLAFDKFTNASLGLANNIVTNVSLGVISAKMVVDNASIGQLTLLTNALNASMGSGFGAYATNASVNLGIYSNVSLGLAFSQYTNVSLGLAFNQYTNVSLGSAIQTASNIGDGSAGVFKQVSGTALQFRKLIGAGAAIVTEGTDVITISLDASFSGEVNTGSNVGAGIGIFDQKVGSNLQFKSLKSTNNTIVFSADASQVYIDASAVGDVTKAYVDGSIANFSTNASVNLAFASNASLGLAFSQYSNASLGLASANYATNVSVNMAFASNASLGLAFNQYTNVSLGLAFDKFTNASLGLANNSYATNASVNLTLASNASLGLAFSQYTNVSLGLANNIVTNVSLGVLSVKMVVDNVSIGQLTLLTNALNASMGSGLDLIISSSTGSIYITTDACYFYIDVSDYVSKTYVNSSIANFATNASVNLGIYSNASLGLAFSQYSNASLGLAFNQYTNVSLGLAFNQYTNVSLGLAFNQYTNVSLGVLSAKMVVDNVSIGQLTLLTNALNASMGSGLGAYATNASINSAFASNASLGLAFSQYTNASLGLAFSQYSNASLGLAGSGGLSRADIDASFATNVSIGFAFSSNVSLGLAFSQYSNASLGSAVQTASNIGGEASIFIEKLGNDLRFRTFTASGSATVAVSGDTINIGINASAGGEVNTASNLGSGEGLYASKVGNDLRFKSLKTTNNTIAFSTDASHVYIDASVVSGKDASIDVLYGLINEISTNVGNVYNYTSNLFINDGDNLATTVSNLDQIMGLIAPAKPDLLTAKDLSLGGGTLSTTKYSAKLPKSLSSYWYTDATSGAIITNYVIDTQFRLYTPSYSSSTPCFRAGLYQDLSTMGTITAVINNVNTTNFVIPVSGAGNASINTSDVSGNLVCSSTAGYGGSGNNFWRKAEAYIDVTRQREGLVKYKISHTEALVSNETSIYYDDINSTPYFSIAASANEITPVTVWLSGISHYGSGSTFNISASIGSGIYYKSYHPTNVALVTAGYGSNVTVNPAAVPNASDAMDISTLFTFNTASQTSSLSKGIITITAYKPNGTSVVSNASTNRRVNTYSQSRATTTVEYFTDESYRIKDGSAGTDLVWDSSNYTQFTLDGSYAQVRNGILTYPISADYGGTSFNGDKFYIRRFTKAAASSGTLTFSGFVPNTQLSAYGSGNVNILIWLTDQGLYFDLGKEFGIGGGSGATMATAISAYSSLSATAINWTLGTYSTGNEVAHVGTYALIVIFKNTTRTMTQITAS